MDFQMYGLRVAPGDTSSTVTNVLLVDQDLDQEELGGEAFDHMPCG